MSDRPPDIRLTAQWLNTVAAGLVVAGGVAPLAAGRATLASVVYAVIFAGSGWFVHRYARDRLGDL